MEDTSSPVVPAQTDASAPATLPGVAPITIGDEVPQPVQVDLAVRFRGLGTNFKAKLIGIDDVPDSRGDKMCQESILKLKAAVLASGRHKQKIVINVSLEGIKIVDILTGEVQHVHPVHRISFIARDLTDRRAFGYVYGVGEGKHQFFGVKTMKVSEVLVLALRDLFQVVYDMKKKEIEEAKISQTNGGERNEEEREDVVYAVPNKIRQVDQPAQPQQQKEGNLFALEQQLSTIQEGINNIDSIGPWSQDIPTSPDTPGFGGDGGDLFGIANLSDISSLSSDFSCASNSVLDYGHAGGGSQQFERSWSSRSANSWQGFNHHPRHNGARASSHSTGNTKPISSVPHPMLPLQSTPSITIDTVISNEVKSAEKCYDDNFNETKITKPEPEKVNGTSRPVIKPTRDTLKSSTSVQSLPGSDKKTKKLGSSFFSRSKKSTKKQKSKKEKSSVKQKTGNSDKSLNRSSSQNISSSEATEDVKDIPIALRGLSRRESVSSINSVQSCVVPATTYSVDLNYLSKSRSSLDDSSVRPIGTQTATTKVQTKNSVEDMASTTPSYIIQSSICPRTRPKAKHSDRVEEVENNPHNPPMFKSHTSVSRTTSKAEEESLNSNTVTPDSIDQEKTLDSEESVSKTMPVWTASFDADFDHFDEMESSTSAEIDEDVDPFTGVSSKELKIPLSASTVFDDAVWSTSNNAEEQADSVVANPVSAEATSTDTFTELSVADFSTDPFASSMSNNSPFEGVDPFSIVKMEDPLSDPFSVFEESDIFNNQETAKPNTVNHEQEDTQNNLPLTSLHDFPTFPTFPVGSDELISRLADITIMNTTSADSSSLTSGMSTPINTQSPVHGVKTLPPFTSNTPPALPPRLPPRPSKTTSPLVVNISTTDECPNVPPPPLPEGVSTPEELLSDEDSEDEEPFDENLCSMPPKTLPPQPPAIPERTRPSSSQSTSSSHTRELSEDSSGETFPQSNASNGMPQKTSSYSDELFNLSSPVAQPAPIPGAKLTREQILSGFGGAPQAGMIPGQQRMMPGQPGMMPGQPGMMQMQMGQAYSQQQMGIPAMGVFPPGPSPAIPPRPGAMRPTVPQPLAGGAQQNPFGDAASTGGMLTPMSNTNTVQEAVAVGKNDPFANLVSGIGGSGAVNNKDGFKNFQMAKAPQPPPRTNPPMSSEPATDFENYMLNSVGGMPVAADNPIPAPRNQAAVNDPFGMGLNGSTAPATTAGADPFSLNQGFSQPFQFN